MRPLIRRRYIERLKRENEARRAEMRRLEALREPLHPSGFRPAPYDCGTWDAAAAPWTVGQDQRWMRANLRSTIERIHDELLERDHRRWDLTATVDV